MSEIWMRGNGPLEGEVKVQGSKNAALPMMAAAVLHEGRTVLHNCPRIADVFEMEAILRSMGVRPRGVAIHWSWTVIRSVRPVFPEKRRARCDLPSCCSEVCLEDVSGSGSVIPAAVRSGHVLLICIWMR